jgi:hypothetical protein
VSIRFKYNSMIITSYSASKIYMIVNSKNDKIFIGSTTSVLQDRFDSHIREAQMTKTQSLLYDEMRVLGCSKFKILLVENVPCFNRDALLAITWDVIQQHKKDGYTLLNPPAK